MKQPLLRETERATRARAGRKAARLDSAYRIPSPEAFREWIVRSRKSTMPAISQRELAALAGVHRYTVSAIEQGRQEPTLLVAYHLWRVIHAAHLGRLWVGIQVRRDNKSLAVVPDSDPDLVPHPIKLRRMRPDTLTKSGKVRTTPPRPAKT